MSLASPTPTIQDAPPPAEPRSLRGLRPGDACVVVQRHGIDDGAPELALPSRISRVGRKYLYVEGSDKPVDPDSGRMLGGAWCAVVYTPYQQAQRVAQREAEEEERRELERVRAARSAVLDAVEAADPARILAIHAVLRREGLL